MGDLHMRTERLEKRAIENEPVERLSSNEDISLKIKNVPNFTGA